MLKGTYRALYNRGSMLKVGFRLALTWRDKLRYLWGVVVYPRPVDFMSRTRFGLMHCPVITTVVRDSWEPETRALVSQLHDSLFVDVGAYIGAYSLLAGRNGNRVISIEPNPNTFKFLAENLKLNGVQGEAYQCAAWKEDGMVGLEVSSKAALTTVKEGNSVKASTLDTILAGRIPDLVKMDVERSEPEVLRGMVKTLEAARKMRIVFEAADKQHLDECLEILKAHGYSCRMLENEASGYSNWLATKEQAPSA